jgi:putative ABC transport system permease protein
MEWLRHLLFRVRALARSEAIHDEIDEELRFHIDMRVEENLQRGMSPEEARRDAERSFGNLLAMKERGYDVRGGRWLETLWQDLRYSARTLRKSPGLTATVLVSLALGIGANTAIFGVVNALLLRPFPVDEPDRLVWVWGKFSRGDVARVSPADLRDYRAQNDVFEHLAAYAEASFNRGGVAEPERLEAVIVTADFFDTLRVAPALGRGFTPDDEQVREPNVVLLSYGLWQRRFGQDPSVVGTSILLDGRRVTVVGVLPAGFTFPGEVDLWAPVPLLADEMSARSAHFLRPIARLNPGVTLTQAQAATDTIAKRLEAQYPASNSGWSLRLEPMHDVVVQDIRLALVVLAGAVGLVLLLACANIANLLLARAGARRREITVRSALGASRSRIVRQLLTETALLALVGAALGLLLAVWGTQVLVAHLPADVVGFFPGGVSVRLDARVLGFTAAVSMLTGLVCGAIPAIQVSRPDLTDVLKEGGRGGTWGIRSNRLRSALVVAEVAGSVVLLVGAGLLLRSFLRLRDTDPGVDASKVLSMRVVLSSPRYQEKAPRVAFFDEALGRIAALPGVESVGTINALPLAPRQGGDTYFTIPGRPLENANDRPVAQFRRVSDGYFRTMGIPVLGGRAFTVEEVRTNAPVVIINATMARHYFPDVDPVGQRLAIDIFGEIVESEIVGVVGDVRQFALEAEASEEMYVPTLAAAYTNIVVRTSGDPHTYVSAVRGELLGVDADQPVANVKTMAEYVEESTGSRQLNLLLLGVFAGVALLLAAVGIYGVTAYSVTQRTHEIGIRMALGAGRRDVMRLVLRHGLVLAVAGVAVGLAAALALARVLESLLYGVSATDAVTFAGVSSLLAVVALAACYVPARRAARVDPLISLRHE